MQANNVLVIGSISIDGAAPKPCKIEGMSVALPDGPPLIPTHPIVLPPSGGIPHPEHPIVLPNPPHEPPLVIWGPDDPRPTLPITWPGYPAWPPTGPVPTPPMDKWIWKYCPNIGWVVVPPGGGGKPQPTP